MNTPVVDFVRRYAQQRTARMHMPGHKGRGPLGCEELDITEIAGADELYEAEGIIAQSEANATQLFGTARTYYSTEGSSQCIRAMLHLALQMRPAKAGRPVLLAARNAHKALLYAAALLDFDIQWLWPAPDAAGALCTCPVEPEALASALDELSAEGRTPFGVYLTSPDYLGFVQDVAGLSAVCHAHGLPLLVDNAHGAYLHFLKEGSRHPSSWARTFAVTRLTRPCPSSRAVPICTLARPCRPTRLRCAMRWLSSAPPAPLISFCSRWTPPTRFWPTASGRSWTSAAGGWGCSAGNWMPSGPGWHSPSPGRTVNPSS